MKKTLSENDLENLFLDRSKQRRPWPIKLARALSVLFFAYTAVFLGMNYANLYLKIRFWYHTEYKNELPPEASSMITQGVTYGLGANSKGVALAQINDNHLLIPNIGVDAPISWQVENEEKILRDKLTSGLIHLAGTDLPGQTGNVFITGHSSDLPWNKGNYKTVFSLLNRVAVGDQVQLRYQNKDYVYKVNNIKVVQPDDVSVLRPTPEPTLTLMTCTPVGTNLRRLIVTAKLIYPDPIPSQPKEGSANQKLTELPKAR